MARINNLTNFLTDVATSIKEKKGYSSSQKIPAEDFDTEISTIASGGNTQEKSVTITQNGSISILPDTGYQGMTQVNLDVNVESDYEQRDGLLNNGATVINIPISHNDEVTIGIHASSIKNYDAYAVRCGPENALKTLLLRNQNKIWVYGDSNWWSFTPSDYVDLHEEYNDSIGNTNFRGAEVHAVAADSIIPTSGTFLQIWTPYISPPTDNGWVIHRIRVYDKSTHELLYDICPVLKKSTNQKGLLCNNTFYAVQNEADFEFFDFGD